MNINFISFFSLFKMRLLENSKLPMWLTLYFYWTAQVDNGEAGLEKQRTEDQEKIGI